jgi:drug/metabolite transporter (DMT)-like permease
LLKSNQNLRAYGFIAAALSAILFSGKGILMKLAFFHGSSIWLFMALRMGYAMPIFIWLYVNASKKAKQENQVPLTKTDYGLIIGLGLCGYYLSGLLDIAGLQFISAGLERLVLYTHPSLVVLFGWLFFKRRVNAAMLWALVISYGGLALAFGSELEASSLGRPWLGTTLVFGSSVIYAGFLLFSGSAIKRMGADRLFTGGMLVCTLMVGVQALFMVSANEWKANGSIHIYALTVAIFGTVVPTILLGKGMKILGAEKTAIIGIVGPLFTLFLGHFTLGEPLTWQNGMGLLLTIAGGFILSRMRN